MKKLITLSTILFTFFINDYTNAQTIKKSSPGSISGATCPGMNIQYSVSLPSGFESCQIKWTATNGEVQSQSGNTVYIKWNDIPGAMGKVEASFSNCGNSNDGKTATSLEELILSIKEQEWGPFNNSIAIDYCTRAQVILSVPRMFVQGTGAVAQPQSTEVIYGWTVPVGSGWKEAGTGKTGFFGTKSHFITIEPTACSTPVQVTVQGFLSDASLCPDGAPSQIATISLTGINPVITVNPPPGYTGGTACNKTPVTFTATANAAFGCISSYTWTKPDSWLIDSKSGNTITLIPSGTSADSKAIKVKANFSCGSSVTSADYVPLFTDPVISSPPSICYGGGTVTLTNVASSVSVNWMPSSNMTVFSGQGTRSVVLKAATNKTSEAGTINATVGCAGVNIPQKNVWVGTPRFTSAITGPTQLTPGLRGDYNASQKGATSVQWSIPSGCYQNYCWTLLSSYIYSDQAVAAVAAGNPGYFGIEATISSSCGYDQRSIYVNVQNPYAGGGGGGGGDCGPSLSVSPNPTLRGDITVNIIYPPDPCDPCQTCIMGADKVTEVEYSLYDAGSNKVLSGKSKNQKIDVRSLKPDNYLLKVILNNKIFDEHIIVK